MVRFDNCETHWIHTQLDPSALRSLNEGWQGIFRRIALKCLPAPEIALPRKLPGKLLWDDMIRRSALSVLEFPAKRTIPTNLVIAKPDHLENPGESSRPKNPPPSRLSPLATD